MTDTNKVVSVGIVGGKVETYLLSNGDSARTLLSREGFSTEGRTVKVNGEPDVLDRTLEDGDFIAIAEATKGGNA